MAFSTRSALYSVPATLMARLFRNTTPSPSWRLLARTPPAPSWRLLARTPPAPKSPVVSLSPRPFITSPPPFYGGSLLYSDSDESEDEEPSSFNYFRSPKGGAIEWTDMWVNNPFLKEGPASCFEMECEGEAIRVRVDMPGACKEDLKVWIEDDGVLVISTVSSGGVNHGEEEKEVNRDKMKKKKRVYHGEIPLVSDGEAREGDDGVIGLFKKEEIKAELKDGVLKVVIPKKVKVDKPKNVFDINLE